VIVLNAVTVFCEYLNTEHLSLVTDNIVVCHGAKFYDRFLSPSLEYAVLVN
jgi:hypothetical protein